MWEVYGLKKDMDIKRYEKYMVERKIWILKDMRSIWLNERNGYKKIWEVYG